MQFLLHIYGNYTFSRTIRKLVNVSRAQLRRCFILHTFIENCMHGYFTNLSLFFYYLMNLFHRRCIFPVFPSSQIRSSICKESFVNKLVVSCPEFASSVNKLDISPRVHLKAPSKMAANDIMIFWILFLFPWHFMWSAEVPPPDLLLV